MADLRIGFIPLCDAAPLVLAKETGLFAAEGLDVQLSREHSWARIRDKLAFGELDAAHMLAPMVVASALGIAPTPERFATAFVFNLNGNGITVSNDLFAAMEAVQADFGETRPIKSEALKGVCADRIERGEGPLTFGMVYPFSTHNYLLRYWLADSGLHPDRDLRVIAAPPPEMTDLLVRGEIDGYCVGEPYNALAEARGVGRQILASAEVWSAAPEKVLGVRANWADQNTDVHRACIRALAKAVDWLKSVDGRTRAAAYLTQSGYLDVDRSVMDRAFFDTVELRGEQTVPYTTYSLGASRPSFDRAVWFASQMIRWGQIDAINGEVASSLKASLLTDLYDEATGALSSDVGVIAQRELGTFLDEREFLPNDLSTYLEGFARHAIRTDKKRHR